MGDEINVIGVELVNTDFPGQELLQIDFHNVDKNETGRAFISTENFFKMLTRSVKEGK